MDYPCMTKQELEAELLKLKEKEEVDALQATLDSYKGNEGIFYKAAGNSYRKKNPVVRGVYIERVSNFHLEKKRHKTDTQRVCYTSEKIDVYIPGDRNKECHFGFRKSVETIYDYKLFDGSRDVVTNEQFDMLVKLAADRAANLLEILKGDGLPSVIFGYEPKEDIDFPYLQLEPYEYSLIGGDYSIFCFDGYRYLMTPNSIKVALEKIDQQEQDLYKGSQYFESCDYAHVNRTEQTLKELQRKIINFK